MAKEFWLNLPVRDIKKTREFFSKLDFPFKKERNTDNSACMTLGEKNVVIMLFEDPMFKGFINSDIADPQKGTEVLLSFDAKSKEEVDEVAKKAIEAGGKSTHKPTEMKGWLYGCVFTDLDGHKWNALYMDMSKMPK
ncbi:glyoxalase [Cytophagales bacterium WSM2-2]|nr:glyoxalase [Cytophagales bacterium WSM2-2]